MKRKRPQFSSKKIKLKVSFYTLILILIVALIRSVTTTDFQNNLQTLFFDPPKVSAILQETTTRWCPEGTSEVHFFSTNQSVQDLPTLNDLCTVQSQPYSVEDLKNNTFKDFIDLRGLKESSRLQVDQKTGHLFRHNELVFSSPQLAEKASKYTKLQ